MSVLGPLGALLLGAAFGYGAQRGAFCMNSGFRGALDGDWTKLKALALAVGMQLVILPGVFAAGLARPVELPFAPVAAIVGGILFGASMHGASGCAAGLWYKLGAGDIGALLALLGMALGATATELGPLAGLRTSLASVSVASWIPPPATSMGVGLSVLLALARSPDSRAGAWSWRQTGLWVGAASTAAWPLSAMAGRDFGLAVVPGRWACCPPFPGVPSRPGMCCS